MAREEGPHVVAHARVAETARCLDDLSACRCSAQISKAAAVRPNKAPSPNRGFGVLHTLEFRFFGYRGPCAILPGSVACLFAASPIALDDLKVPGMFVGLSRLKPGG
jgi:hypothetical protein